MKFEEQSPAFKLHIPEGSISFRIQGGLEVVRFDPNGDCFVRGELVENNKECWEALKNWIKTL